MGTCFHRSTPANLSHGPSLRHLTSSKGTLSLDLDGDCSDSEGGSAPLAAKRCRKDGAEGCEAAW